MLPFVDGAGLAGAFDVMKQVKTIIYNPETAILSQQDAITLMHDCQQELTRVDGVVPKVAWGIEAMQQGAGYGVRLQVASLPDACRVIGLLSMPGSAVRGRDFNFKVKIGVTP